MKKTGVIYILTNPSFPQYVKIGYNGETWSLTALAKHLTGVKSAIAGPKYFKYKGEWLNTIRRRSGV